MQRLIMIYLLWALVILSSILGISTERIAEESNNRRPQSREEDETQFRTKKQQPIVEKAAAPDDDDDKSTLAQQVLDGKYALIQTELFSNPVKRPGILSYEVNPEVPKDNINNLGGLKPEEIWLAENHLLVLKGGGFSEKEQSGKVIWPPIDNYIAPKRQVKIPPNPKVPPPFPIQLKEGGPIEVIQGKDNKTSPPYFNGPFGPPFLFPLTPNIPKGSNNDKTKPGQGNSTEGNGGGVPFPYLPPELGLYPPAIAFLPPPGNLTELDEDDPRIYYPPKYDFVYKKNYSSFVPPGPLVPGIVLPPPPNFFAPLENSTKSQRLTDNKSTVSAKKSSKIRLPLPNGSRHKITPQVIMIKQKGHSFREQKLISPIRVPSNFENYERVPKKKQNVSNEDWIPIPAPRPFYITEISKLRALTSSQLTDPSLKYLSPQNGWDLDNTTSGDTSTKEKDLSIINSYINSASQDIKKDTPYTTERSENNLVTPSTSSEFEPEYENEPSPQPLIIEPKPKYIISKYNTPILRGKLINPVSPGPPAPQYVEHFIYSKPYVEVNTVIPKGVLSDVSIKTPSESGRIRLPNIKYDDFRNTLKPSSKPLTYLYYDQGSKYQGDNGGYSYEAPLSSSAQNSFRGDEYSGFPASANTQYQINSYSSTTQKPPVYEYSYSAPGYGTVEAPKVGNNIVTTPKPLFYESNFKPSKQSQLSYFDYQSSPQLSDYNIKQTTVQPTYTTQQTSPRAKPKYVKGDTYHTENPYLSYNTQDLGLLDDITKKYFSLFGQKLNHEGSREASTTIAPLKNQNYFEKSQYKDYEAVSPRPTKTPRTHIRFPEVYNIQNDDQYYQNPQDYSIPRYRPPNKSTKPNSEQNDNYSYYYSAANAGYRNYKDYNPDIVRPNHPLHSDIDVNYKIPNPTINPDAEFINPAYVTPRPQIGNSYVSYRLPGNSGHFYFLTPQAIRQQQYPIQNTRLRYPDLERRRYIPRNVQREVLK